MSFMWSHVVNKKTTQEKSLCELAKVNFRRAACFALVVKQSTDFKDDVRLLRPGVQRDGERGRGTNLWGQGLEGSGVQVAERKIVQNCRLCL